MAFLLLLHQKMRLQRKENQLTLKQLQFSSKVDRMQKKVDKRQKYYDKLKKQLERQANYYKNSMNMQISNMFGLGTNSVNLMNPYGSNGAAQVFLNNISADALQQMLGGNSKEKVEISPELLKAIQSGQYTIAQSEIKAGTKINGKELTKDIAAGTLYNPYDVTAATFDEGQAAIYKNAQQLASYKVSEMQAQAQQYKAAYENNVSIWTEAQLEQLEAQEEWEMDMLSEEQSDMEAEKNSIEVQLQRVQEEKKNVEQALGNAIQDSAPKFGLA